MSPLPSAALTPSTVVAVVGAGAMGGGIAQIAAAAGHPVLVFDNRADTAAKAIDSIRATFTKLVGKGKMTTEVAEAAGARLRPAATLTDFTDAGLVVEAIAEDVDVKRALFGELETVVGEDCILTSNTSSISITAIGSALRKPGRLAGLHFFNPAPLMPLVEVVSGLATTPEVAGVLFDTATAWGKIPVHAASSPGFIVNRVARPYYAEALRLLTERSVDIATIDTVCREAGGFRMGPFELMDMIGHDVNFAVTQSVWRAYFNDPRFTPSVIQQELVAGGFLGRKSGRGFYDHGTDADPARMTAAPEAAVPPPTDIVIHGNGALAQALAERLEERRILFRREPADDDRAATADGVALFVTDGRTATERTLSGRGADGGDDAVIVVDLALDYRRAARVAYAAALQCTPAQRAAAVGLLQAAGFATTPIADSPALILMRIICMLANEAADTVQQGVCSADAVDTAMRLGTNYPRGPLAWADAIGIRAVITVLTNLAAYYGEDRYRLSPYLRQRALTGAASHD